MQGNGQQLPVQRRLRELTKVSTELAAVRERESRLRELRDRHIHFALAEGVRIAEIARAADVDPSRVSQMKSVGAAADVAPDRVGS